MVENNKKEIFKGWGENRFFKVFMVLFPFLVLNVRIIELNVHISLYCTLYIRFTLYITPYFKRKDIFSAFQY